MLPFEMNQPLERYRLRAGLDIAAFAAKFNDALAFAQTVAAPVPPAAPPPVRPMAPNPPPPDVEPSAPSEPATGFLAMLLALLRRLFGGS